MKSLSQKKILFQPKQDIFFNETRTHPSKNQTINSPFAHPRISGVIFTATKGRKWLHLHRAGAVQCWRQHSVYLSFTRGRTPRNLASRGHVCWQEGRERRSWHSFTSLDSFKLQSITGGKERAAARRGFARVRERERSLRHAPIKLPAPPHRKRSSLLYFIIYIFFFFSP